MDSAFLRLIHVGQNTRRTIQCRPTHGTAAVRWDSSCMSRRIASSSQAGTDVDFVLIHDAHHLASQSGTAGILMQ